MTSSDARHETGLFDLETLAGMLRHRGLSYERTRHSSSAREKVFADRWEKECAPRRGINSGLGLLFDLLIVHAERRYHDPSYDGHLVRVPDQRDAELAATIVQWLGTNVGWSWLTTTLREAGYVVMPEGVYKDLRRDADDHRLIKRNIQISMKEMQRGVEESIRRMLETMTQNEETDP